MKLKNKIIENRVGLLVTIGILLVVTIIVGISYAYFGKIVIKNNNNVISSIRTDFYIFATEGSSEIALEVNASDLDPNSASNEYTSYIENTTSDNLTIALTSLYGYYGEEMPIKCEYDLVYQPVVPYEPNKEAVANNLNELTISGTSYKGNSFSEVNITGDSEVTLYSGYIMSDGLYNTYENDWTFTIRYYNLDIIQDGAIGQGIEGNITVKNVKCNFYKDMIENTLINKIITYNGGEKELLLKDTPKVYNKTNTVEKSLGTEGGGLYHSVDDLGDVFYFKGNVSNNFITFGTFTQDVIIYYYGDEKNEPHFYNSMDDCKNDHSTGCNEMYYASSGDPIWWRIIRTNGDGSVRLIYVGSINGYFNFAEGISLDGSSIFAFSNSEVDASQASGFQYVEGSLHGYGKCDDVLVDSCEVDGKKVYNSNAKNVLEEWFLKYTDLSNYSIESSNSDVPGLADAIYCNDRVAYNYKLEKVSDSEIDSIAVYEPFLRISDFQNIKGLSNNPTFKCSLNEDRFTVSKDIGNGALNIPIGLISADEFSLSSNSIADVDGNTLEIRSDTIGLYSYLTYPGAISFSWSMSPGIDFRMYGEDFNTNFIYLLYSNPVPIHFEELVQFYKEIDINGFGEKHPLKPVISIPGNIMVYGNGTGDNPYRLEA